MHGILNHLMYAYSSNHVKYIPIWIEKERKGQKQKESDRNRQKQTEMDRNGQKLTEIDSNGTKQTETDRDGQKRKKKTDRHKQN